MQNIDLGFLQSLNRLRNLFPRKPEDDYVRKDIQEVGDNLSPPDMTQRFSELYKPENRFSDMLNQQIGNFPQREAPSKMRQLGSVLVGLGSENPMEASDQFRNYHYYNKLADWKQKTPMIEKAADNERSGNINQRMFAQNVISNEMTDKRLEETERQNRERIRVSDENRERLESKDRATIDLNNRKLALQKFRAEHPNYLFKTRQDGKIVAFDPQNPLKPVDTGVQSTELSDLDKINFNLDADLKKIAAQGVKEKDVKGTPTFQQKLTGVSFSPTQRTAEENRKAREAVSKNPTWKDYIQFDESGKFIRTGTPEGSKGGIFSGSKPTGDPKILEEVNKYIFGTTAAGKNIDGWVIR
jgi:hypothetical protein